MKRILIFTGLKVGELLVLVGVIYGMAWLGRFGFISSPYVPGGDNGYPGLFSSGVPYGDNVVPVPILPHILLRGLLESRSNSLAPVVLVRLRSSRTYDPKRK